MAFEPTFLQRGALALELRPGAAPARASLDLVAAEPIAALVARDLARFAPGAEAHDLGLAAALFDPVELLRPGWPAHAELDRLLAQAAAPGILPPAALAHPCASPHRQEGRVIAFAGEGLPDALQPEPTHAGGPLRLLPWVLRGPRDTLAPIGDALESTLLDTGMAAADTALALQDAFAVPIEHVRYLTAHDLAALMAMQYEHAGLSPLWPLVETALFGDDEDVWLDAPPEPLVRMRTGRARIALASDANVHVQRRTRQFAAVLTAHGIDTAIVDLSPGADARAALTPTP
jgi:hypothetical protein